MPVHSRVVFPRELTDTILDNLSDDYTSLNSCALVCRAWKPSSQRALFRSVKFEHVKMDAFDRSMTTLSKVLKENPELAKLVRKIRLQWSMSNVISFLKQVPELPMVEQLELRYISFISWADEAVEAARSILAWPSVKRLKLTDTTFEDMEQFCKVLIHCGVNVDVVHFHRLSIIKGKTIRTRFWAPDSDDENSSDEKEKEQPSPRYERDAPRAKVRTLDIARGSPSMIASWMSGPDSPFDLSELKSLRYEEDVPNPQFDALNKLLAICRQRLEHLEIYCPRDIVKKGNVDISTATLPSLKCLVISGIGPYSLANAILFLSQLSSNSGINKLILKFTFGNMTVYNNDEPPKGWRDLDAAVDNAPLLHLETIEILLPRRSNHSDENVFKMCKYRLPKVMEKSICTLTIL
ncbi:hypothetical protein M413DRAFT_447642 [Hebeloma cylindrosporum]|uniref:F-box domain-containing protein n=1 Tax=Hebeloma cylindrosporum TaxID=76867 RepID=A0A0C3C352_HEBCY|nr:hypothetical protein M413DRAFT_447642 [Hebeloma cylindrosporum h7]